MNTLGIQYPHQFIWMVLDRNTIFPTLVDHSYPVHCFPKHKTFSQTFSQTFNFGMKHYRRFVFTILLFSFASAFPCCLHFYYFTNIPIHRLATSQSLKLVNPSNIDNTDTDFSGCLTFQPPQPSLPCPLAVLPRLRHSSCSMSFKTRLAMSR